MKDFTIYINEKLKITKNISRQNKYNYYPKTRDELKDIVNQLIKERGNDGDFNDIDTSEITDMSGLFENSKFNGDISEWNVSAVENMDGMFYSSKFDGDISKWNVRKVTKMDGVFDSCLIKDEYKPKFNK